MEYERTPKVSVVVPVYGVEQFIGRAAESMMEQTLDDVEFIFVDDCTPDNSIEVLQEVISHYPRRLGQVIILAHDVNRGLPAARNTGLSVAHGKYIYHWDSDDYAEPQMLEALYKKAEKDGCDYVWCDWFLNFNTNSRRMCQPDAATPRDALSIILAGAMKYNVWNKLVAHSLYEETGVRFPEGYSMGEDMTMIRLLANAHKIGHVAIPLYHYIRTNEEAMTQIYSSRHLDELQYNTDELCRYLSKVVRDEAIAREMSWFKLSVKLPFLFSGRREDRRLWNSWYQDANREIMSNKRQTLRTRLLQWSAAHGLGMVNSLYNAIVFKLVYGIIYR